MEKSPFDITLNYTDKQIINRNFTLTTELHHDVLLPVDCGNNRYRLCLVALSLQIQSDIMSIKYWCQPPAFPFANLNPLQKLHTCILPAVNVTQEPTITMIINSRDIGKVTAIATANFTYSPHYDTAQKTLTPIFIFNNDNATKEDILSRSVRSVMNGNDDAVESELDDPDCTSEITYSSNGLPKQEDPSKDDEVGRQYLKNEKHRSHLSFQSDDAAAPVDFASGIIPDEDRNQPIGEYDDSLAVDCTKGDPLYGHPNVEWIRVANASDFMIDQRINQNVDPDSDGIDFPKMDTYILQVRMKPYVFLQYVSVPSSNVILLYVVVHYESGKRHNVYHSKVEQSPVVENFLAKEPTKFFEVYLNATDDGLPPSDVTLDVGYCIAPRNTHPIIADSEDSLSGPVDLRMNNNADQNDGSISPLIAETKLNPIESPDNSMLVKTQPSIFDINTENNDPRQIPVNVNRDSIILDPISQPLANDVERTVPIFETQESPNVPIPSNSLFGTVDSTVSKFEYVPSDTFINQQGSPLLQIVRQPSMLQLADNTVGSSSTNMTQDQPTAVQVKSPLLIAPMDISRTPTLLNNLPAMTTSQVPAQYSCYNNPRIIGNNNVQSVFSLNIQRQTTISDQINSQSSSPGYSFSSFQYPYHTIVINLRVSTYVHSLSLGSQSNVQRYGLRLYHPGRNVDDTYYSSMTPEYDNQPTIAGIPLAKVAIRMYLNLYTTSDGRPPSNIKIVLNACFDSSSMDSAINPMIGGQYYRTPSIPQVSYIPTVPRQRFYTGSYYAPEISVPAVASDSIVGTENIPINQVRSNSVSRDNNAFGTIYSNVRTPYDVSGSLFSQSNIAQPPSLATDPIDNVRIPSKPFIATLDTNDNNEQSYYPSIAVNPPLGGRAQIPIDPPVVIDPPFGGRAPIAIDPPFGDRAPIPIDPPFEGRAPIAIDPPFGGRVPIAIDPPFGGRAPIAIDPPFGGRAPIAIDPPFEGRAPISIDPSFGGRAPIDIDPPFEGRAPISIDPSFGGRAPIDIDPPVATDSPFGGRAPIAIDPPIVIDPLVAPKPSRNSAPSYYYSPIVQRSPFALNNLPTMTTSQVPAQYSCYNNPRIIGNNNVQSVFSLNIQRQTTISDQINSQSSSPGYSFSSFQYPYHTIVINLRVSTYVHSLSLGSQSNVQRYGLRLYHPGRNVDDTYYSSMTPEYDNQPTIAGIPLAKVAIRMYLNLYTTSDGRPPSNIKIVLNACFDSSSMDSAINPMIGGQYYRTPSIPQVSYIPNGSQEQQSYYSNALVPILSVPTMNVVSPSNNMNNPDVLFINPALPLNNRVPSRPLIATVDFNDDVSQQPDFSISASSPSNPIPFVRTPGQCFDQILIVGGSHITMIRSRNPVDQLVGPEINFGGTGYTFASPSDTYEFEVHFAQPFTIKYIFMSYSSNAESFKVEASHAGMLGVFTSTNTKDGLVVDGFPPMLVSMLVINIMHTTDGSLPNHVTLSIGVCNPIYSPSNEGNEAPEMTDCTSQLRLIGNSKQVARVDIKTPTTELKANNLINPNQDGMDFLTTDEYTIDIVLNKTMSIDSITLNPLSNVDSFKIQCHNSHGYYLEIKSIIGWKTINGLANTHANLIRIILLGTEDGNPPNHISIKIAACIPTSLPKIMRSPFKHEMITKRRKPSKSNRNNFGVFDDQLSSAYTEQQVPIQDELLQPDIQSPIFLQLTANVDMQQGQEPGFRIISSPVMQQSVTNVAYRPLINSQVPMQQNIFVSPIVNPTLPIPSYRAPSPSGYTCSQDYQITTSVHFNYVSTLCCSSQSSIMDSTSSNSLLSNNGYSFASHHYPYQTIVISLKFVGYVQSLSLGSQTNVQRYGLRVFNPARNVDDTYYSSTDPNTGQSTISNVHLAKVAIRLYINLYTTNDGRPPRNIQLKFNICFDLRSPSNGDRPSSVVERPSLPSPMLIPEWTVYASQPLQIFVQPIISCISSPIRTLFVDEPQQSLIQPFSAEIIIEQLVPVILTQPSYIMIQSVLMPTIHIFSSPVLPPPLIVDIARYPTPIRQFDPSPSINIERIVIIEQQRPIISLQLPSIIIDTVFSPIVEMPSIVQEPLVYQSVVIEIQQQVIVSPMIQAPIINTIYSPIRIVPQVIILRMPSPIIDPPIIEIPSIVEEPLVYQSLVIQIEQQVIFSPMIQAPIINTIYSPIRIVPQVIILRMPSPIIDPPIIEKPIIRRPPPIIIEEIINIVERPVVQPSILVERIVSPIVEMPTIVQKPLVYQSLVIEIQQQVIVSPMIQAPIINTICSPIRIVPQVVILRMPSPIIDPPIIEKPIIRRPPPIIIEEIINIIERPVVQPSILVERIVSPIIEIPSIVEEPLVYQSLVIQIEQQVIFSPMIQAPIINTIYSPIRIVPQVIILRMPSPIIDPPIIEQPIIRRPPPIIIEEIINIVERPVIQPSILIETIVSPIVEMPSIVQEPLVYQSLVIQIEQQVIFSPMIQAPIINTIYSPIRIVPQVIILRMPSPIIDPPIIEQPIIRRPPPIIIEEIINIVERPVVQPSILVERIASPIVTLSIPMIFSLRSPIIEAPIVQRSPIISIIEKPVVYEPLPINIDIEIEQPVVMRTAPPPIIDTVYSPIQSVLQQLILTISSPAIESLPIIRMPEIVPINFQPSVLIEQQPQVISPVVMPSIPEVIIQTIYSPRIPAPIYDTISSPIVTAQVFVEILEHRYSSRAIPSSPIIEMPIYVQRIEQPIVFGRRPPVSIEIQEPTIHIISSSIVSPPVKVIDPVVRPLILSVQRNTEMCGCQCPTSGFVPIVYNSRQQSCTIGAMRKR
ncbi:unnamed protein product [Rotaria socialis]